MDAIPNMTELELILAYMMFHLNYKRQFFEHRPEKIRKMILHLQHVHRVLAPKDALALYFSGLMQHRLHNTVGSHTINALDVLLKHDPYWQERLNDFGLSPSDLRTGNFPVYSKNDGVSQ